MKLQIFLKGFAMGVADIIPGVSGGTIAFITGIYDDLLGSVSQINRALFELVLKFKLKDIFNHMNGKFLLPLGIGILTAIISTSRLVHYLLNNHPEQTWATFFGLIGASIYFIGKKVENKFHPTTLGFFVSGAIFGYVMVSLIPVQTPENPFFIFLCGMIAITAMILPGISGSFLLVILGKYAYITGALKHPTSISSLEIILAFCAGCFVGLASFSKFLKYLLSHHRSWTLAALTGIMLGAMKKLWPWKNILDTKTVGKKIIVTSEKLIIPTDWGSAEYLCIALMILGAASVIAIEWFSNRTQN